MIDTERIKQHAKDFLHHVNEMHLIFHYIMFFGNKGGPKETIFLVFAHIFLNTMFVASITSRTFNQVIKEINIPLIFIVVLASIGIKLLVPGSVYEHLIKVVDLCHELDDIIVAPTIFNASEFATSYLLEMMSPHMVDFLLLYPKYQVQMQIFYQVIIRFSLFVIFKEICKQQDYVKFDYVVQAYMMFSFGFKLMMAGQEIETFILDNFLLACAIALSKFKIF